MSNNETSDLEAFGEAFQREFGDNPPGSLDQHHQNKFDLWRNGLLAGESWIYDRDPDYFALEIIEQLAKVLRLGQPAPEVLNMLADFLDSVLERSNSSATTWAEEAKLAYRILGYEPNGRPTHKRALLRAVAAFEMHHTNGANVEEAEREAFDAYQAALGHPEQTYASFKRKGKVGITRGAYSKEVTVAERLLESTIRPALRRAELLGEKPKGPKPRGTNITAKPHP